MSKKKIVKSEDFLGKVNELLRSKNTSFESRGFKQVFLQKINELINQ